MKYLKATILVGFPEDEIAEWSEHADVTFSLAFLHEPDAVHPSYLIDHDEYPEITEKEAKKLFYKCFTKDGGV